MRRGNILIISLLAVIIVGTMMGIAGAAGDTAQSDSTSSQKTTSSSQSDASPVNIIDFKPTIITTSSANPTTSSTSNANQAQAVGVSSAEAKPTADFVADKVSGEAPLSVQFTSITTGGPTDYFWVFEPSSSSDWNSHHPVTAKHTFKKPGVYTISLTVNNGAGSDTAMKDNYIVVT